MSLHHRDHPPAADAPLRRAHEHLLVRLGEERFALPVAGVQEALPTPPIRPVPAMASNCVGLLGWRGRQLSVRCPRAALGWAARRPVGAVLLLRGELGVAAVAVDELLDVQAIAPERVRPVPGLQDPLAVVRGVAVCGGELLVVLAAEALAAAVDAPLPAEAAS